RFATRQRTAGGALGPRATGLCLGRAPEHGARACTGARPGAPGNQHRSRASELPCWSAAARDLDRGRRRLISGQQLGDEVLDLGKSIGLFSDDGNLDTTWFQQPLDRLESILTNQPD